MRLLYLANHRLPTEKAYGIQMVKMCESLASEGVEVELILPIRRNPSGKDIYEFYGAKKNFKEIRLFSPDLYFPGKLDKYAFILKTFLSSLILATYSLYRKTDYIFSRDELPLYFLSFFKKNLCFEAHKFSNKRSLFYKRFANKGVKIVTISKGLKDEFINFGFDPENILVAHDGVDLKDFNIPHNAEECRLLLKLPLGKKIVGYVGQLRTMGMKKGIDDLIKAMEILKRTDPELILVIVGGNGEDVNYYREITERSNLTNQILFLGQKEHREIPFYLRAFDILVMPFPNTKHYALYMSPLKLFEYMASGRPIVASDLPTIREVLSPSNSILVPPDDAIQLAVAIEKVLTDSELSTTLSRQALADVQNFTWQKRAEKTLNFIT